MLPTRLLSVHAGLRAAISLVPRLWSDLRIRLGTWLLGRDKAAPQPSAASLLSAGMRRPGVDCPRCGTLITVSIENLLSGQPTVCPNALCGLRLEVDQDKSCEALAALGRHVETLRDIRESENISAPLQPTNLKWSGVNKPKMRDRQP